MVLRALLPIRRNAVMSVLPPAPTNRLPLARSAPSTSACTNSGISAGSVEPSASIVTMMSPVQASIPHASALPLPERVWVTKVASGHSFRATATVSSAELPSTKTI